MRINIHLVKAFQFLYQFCLMVWHKFKKKYIISSALNGLVYTNNVDYNSLYSKLDALFVYYMTFVKVNPEFVKFIMEEYLTND